MSRFSQTSDIPPVRLIEFGKEKSGESTVPVKPAVINLRSQRIEQFLTLKNLAVNTRRNYERHLKQFSLWVNKDWHQITLNDLKRYKTYLESGRQLKQGSVGAVLIAIKSFFAWLIKAGYIEDNPSAAISIPVTPETKGKNLELFQVEALLEALEGRKTERRDRAILCLMVFAGLRAEEISQLNAGDYNGVEITIRQAKHGSVGRVPVDEQTDAALRANLRVRVADCEGGMAEDEPMFVSTSHRNKGQRLGYEGIYKLIKALAKDAGWPDIHPHKGRHTYASQLIENGMDAYLAMTLMRQRSVKAFEVYSQKVRYKTAKGVFFEGKGEVERQPMSLEELVSLGGVPHNDAIQLKVVEPDILPPIQAVDLPSNVVQVGLTLEVLGRKKGKVRREIEERVLSPYQMVKLKPRGNEYELTVLVEEDEDLSAILAQMEWEMQVLGELDECLVKVKLSPEQEVNGFAPVNGVAVDKPEGIELEAVIKEPSDWPKITSIGMSSEASSVYQLKITLLGVRPQVWRRFQVPETTTLAQLHFVIQTVMGWEGYHLHQFSESEDEAMTLAELIEDDLFSFGYLYDFGDMWQHEIKVEKRLASKPGKNYPICLAGKRACPPEDCGGDWGYAHLLRVLKNPRHSQYEERMEWVGSDFDPKVFDIDEVNQALRELELEAAVFNR
ncbi:IS1096 element passenger TnpR family protein [Acaryochloris marina]|uniref:IS1096 element passenger TnpR family protein n=1 Tax=Acaryochloris marina TaxID=155978 RepID=UPI0021C3CB11|nr:tyrosine-type recombinase/integrase [Acaryochloris marina]BDM83556.1 hypothetical protein AM10699_64170 [Acaryochloris marina MBIC10699]